jgi:protoporphyrinogen oxidase
VSYPRNMSPHTSPEGTGTIQAEVYFSKKYKPLRESPQAWIDPVIAGLRRCGVIRESVKIVFKDAMVIPYANIIFDLDRPAALAKVHGFLDDVGIGYCGRYGEWGYLWSDEAFLSGESAAQKVLARAAA